MTVCHKEVSQQIGWLAQPHKIPRQILSLSGVLLLCFIKF